MGRKRRSSRNKDSEVRAVARVRGGLLVDRVRHQTVERGP